MENFIQTAEKLVPGILGAFWNIVLAIVLLFVGKKIIKIILKLSDSAMQRGKLDTTVQRFLLSLTKMGLTGLLIYMIADLIGVPTASFIALIGSAGLAIGLALQGSLGNFAGGVLLLALKPFSVGDYISETSSGTEGSVEAIDLFYTKMKTPDNKVIFIPNGALSNATITNYSLEKKRRVEVLFQVAYGTDIDAARKLIKTLINQRDTVIMKEETTVFVDRLDSSAIVLNTRFWVPSASFFAEKWAMTEEINQMLAQNGMKAPFAQLDIHMVSEK